jgi:hypothetical protein
MHLFDDTYTVKGDKCLSRLKRYSGSYQGLNAVILARCIRMCDFFC